MIAATTMQLVLVTPETTLLETPVRGLRFPLYDGQMGVLPGRAPVVGRLGIGELRVEAADGGHQNYFLDGGFLQIKGHVVTLLTDRAVKVSDLKADVAEADLAKAMALKPTDDAGFAAKEKAIERARKMSGLARRMPER